MQATLPNEAFRPGTTALLPSTRLARAQNCTRQPDAAVPQVCNYRDFVGAGLGIIGGKHNAHAVQGSFIFFTVVCVRGRLGNAGVDRCQVIAELLPSAVLHAVLHNVKSVAFPALCLRPALQILVI